MVTSIQERKLSKTEENGLKEPWSKGHDLEHKLLLAKSNSINKFYIERIYLSQQVFGDTSISDGLDYFYTILMVLFL